MWQDVQQTRKIIVSLGEKNVHFVTAGFILDRNVRRSILQKNGGSI